MLFRSAGARAPRYRSYARHLRRARLLDFFLQQRFEFARQLDELRCGIAARPRKIHGERALDRRRRAMRHLEKGRVVIFGAGTGNPYFTTDTAGSLRAIEIKADAILKGTRVDGIYSADPEIDKTAKKFNRISFSECISKNLRVMDMTAFTLCMENNLPIIVFDMNSPGNLLRVVTGEKVGTLVS